MTKKPINLIEAAELDDLNLVEAALKDINVIIDQRNQSGWTALTIAAKKGNKKVIEKLIEKKVDINLRGPENSSALHFAAENSDLEIMNILLKNGANVSAISNPIGWIQNGPFLSNLSDRSDL